MQEQIKIGLLAVIAGTLIVNTVMVADGGGTAASDDAPFDPLKSTSANASAPAGHSADDGHDHSTAADAFNTPPEDNTPKTGIQFGVPVHDFGTIKQDTKNEYLFEFTNTGDNPLIISNATGSCGCTVPEYPKEPIAPGATGEIKVVYSPGKQSGNQTKTVSVTANTEPAVTQVTIKAVVEPEGGE